MNSAFTQVAQKTKTTQKQRSIEPSDDICYPGGMIAIKEEKMDIHSMTHGRSQARLSALVEAHHENDSSMMQVDFGRLGESIENGSPLKKHYEVNSARNTALMNANTFSNTGTERTRMSPAKPPNQ